MLTKIFFIWIPIVLGTLLVVFQKNGALLFGESIFLFVLMGVEYSRRSDRAMTLRLFIRAKIVSILIVALLFGISLYPLAIKIIHFYAK